MDKNGIFDKIRTNKWYRQALNAKAYYIFTCCKAAMDCVGADLSFWFLTNKKYLEGIFIEKFFTDKAAGCLGEQKKDKKYIDKILIVCEEKGAVLDSFYKKYKNENFDSFSFQDVVDLLRELDVANYDYWVNSYLCDVFDPNGDDLLRQEMKKENANLTESEIGILMRNNWLNYAQEERLAFIKLKQNFSEETLKKHAENYFYIDNSWESTGALSVDDFRERLVELKDDEIEIQVNDLTTNWGEEHQDLQSKYGLSDNIMNVFYLFRQLFKIRDQRKRRTLLTNYFYDKLFQRLSTITAIPFEDFRVVLIREVKDDVGYLRKIIGERNKSLLEIYNNKSSRIVFGDEAMELYGQLQTTFKREDAVIKGTPASSGAVKGIVRVIMGESHFSKFNDGEILVAPMTRPEFAPLMRKSLAIVTDEGGVTCHAAIVSRELGIPCIIGTQIATKVLRDGDLVEVDASSGVIKKIN